MKYIRAFFEFWRKFIVGDDSRIAIVIMWSLLFVKSLSENFMNGWFIVPIVVILLFIYLVYSAVKKSPQTAPAHLFWTGFVPMIVVVSLPSLLFRINVGTTAMQFTYIPLSICIVVGAAVTIVLAKALYKFPILSVFVLGCFALGLMTIWQAGINNLSYNIAHNYSTLGAILSPLITLGFFVACVLSLRKNKLR